MKNNNESHFESCEYKKIVKFLKGFSLEITPFVADKIENLSQFIKPSQQYLLLFFLVQIIKILLIQQKNKTRRT